MTTLQQVLREKLDYYSVKDGCTQGGCGACTVLVNGQVALACLLPASRLEGAEVVTLEGLNESNSVAVIQESFIAPEIHIEKEDYIFSGLNSAARAVGGDLYDVVEIEGGRAAIFLGDVSGKGFPAAYMARLFSDVHHFIGIDPRPETVFASLNASLCSRPHRGMFTTMVCGLITPNEPGVSPLKCTASLLP